MGCGVDGLWSQGDKNKGKAQWVAVALADGWWLGIDSPQGHVQWVPQSLIKGPGQGQSCREVF